MKTIVELLRVELILNSKYRETLNGKVSFTIGLSKFDEIINQAKEMEKQQIIDANIQGFEDGINHEMDIPTKFQNSLQYYNETYKDKL